MEQVHPVWTAAPAPVSSWREGCAYPFVNAALEVSYAATSRRSSRKAGARTFRYTVDASVFVNAFNSHERGHAESLQMLAEIQERDDAIIVPTLIVAEIASAVARASDDTAGALRYANVTAELPHLTLVGLTPALVRRAAELGATHRLRGADAVYLAVAGGCA